MEKFGIFELLDALAALTAPKEDAPPPPEEEEKNAPAPSPEEGGPASLKGDALESFLSRHDERARRAKKVR